MIWLYLSCAQVEPQQSGSTTFFTTQPVEKLEQRIVELGGGLDGGWNYPASTMVPVYSEGGKEFQQAQQLFKEKQFQEAANVLFEILKEEPEHIGAYSLLSSTFLNMGDLLQAEKSARRALEIKNSSLGYCNLATVLMARSKYEEAQHTFQEALKSDSKSFLAIRNLASLTYKGEELEASEHYLRLLLRLEPNDSYIYTSLGQVLAEQGKLKEAEEVYRYRLKELEFVSKDILNTDSGMSLELPLALGEILRRQKKWNEARFWFEQTIVWSKKVKTSWTLPEVYQILSVLRIAKTYSQEGDREMAEKLVQQADLDFFKARKNNNGKLIHLQSIIYEVKRKDALSY